MTLTVEERLSKVEAEVERLKSRFESLPQKPGWISRIKGAHKGDAVYEEILRLGKEIRDAEEAPMDMES